jgi:hypothetical protein
LQNGGRLQLGATHKRPRFAAQSPSMRSGKGPPLPVLALAASRIQHVLGSSCWIQSSYAKYSSLPDIISFLKFLLPLTGTNDLFVMLDQQSNHVPHFD